jgi:uncharacterized pyridoxal phosphate-containing UPF0001 family protein
MYQLKERILQEHAGSLPEGLNADTFIVSMGTSADFEQAIVEGANEVRVGTILFGERDYSKKKAKETSGEEVKQ